MLFDSSLRKELGRAFTATLVVLATIVMTMMLIRALGQASGGKVDPSDVMLVMGFTVLSHLPTLLALSLFVAIVATLSRMYLQSEMVIWFTTGQGLTAFLKPLLRFAWPIVLMIAVLALIAWPWANQQVRELRDRYEQRGDLDRVAPGQFRESAGGERVFFIEQGAGEQQSGSNIFISTRKGDGESVTSAQKGRLEIQGEDRVLILNHGQQTEVNTTTGEARVSDFDEYGVVIGTKTRAAIESESPRYKNTLQLLNDRNPRNMAELTWRLGLTLSALTLVVLALASSYANPRSGRTAPLLFALLAFATYYNLLTTGENWIADGRVHWLVWLIGLHGGVLAIALLWLTARQRNWSIWPLRGHRAAAGAPA